MAGLPWFKQQVDLRRDPRSLVLGEILGDPRAWTYVVEMRMYLAENAPTGCVSGLHAEVAFERGSGWTGERGRLLSALRDSGFVRAGPARDGIGTEIEDLDWLREQGAHVAKFERDAKKPRGNTHKVVSPSRDIGGTLKGPARTPRWESRELRVESREEETAIAAVGRPPDSQQVLPVGNSRTPKRTTAAEEFVGWARTESRAKLAPDAPDNCALKRHQWPKLGEAVKHQGLAKMQAAFRVFLTDAYWLGKGLPLGAFVADWEKYAGEVSAPKAPPQKSKPDFYDLQRAAEEVKRQLADEEERKAAKRREEARNGTPARS